MAICGYLVLAAPGAAPVLADRIAALPGCDVVPAEGHDVLLLVTESAGLDEDVALRERLEALEGLSSLLLTFGDIAPDRPIPTGSRDR